MGGFLLMKVLFLHDDFFRNSTQLLIREGLLRGHEIVSANLRLLFCKQENSFVHGKRVTQVMSTPPYYSFLEEPIHDLNDFDFIWVRQEPPWDLSYYYGTLALSLVRKETLIINRPEGLRNINEKMSILRFPELIPPTLVTSSLSDMQAFALTHPGPLIIKALGSFASRHVALVQSMDELETELVVQMTQAGKVPVMVQLFQDAVYEGEKRIVLWKGKILGALLRKPPPKSFITNPDLGGLLDKTTLTLGEKTLAMQVAKELLKEGILLAGLDLIGGRLTEINVTSVGLLTEMNWLDGRRYEKEMWDDVEGMPSIPYETSSPPWGED